MLGEGDDPAQLAREAEDGVIGVAGGDGSLAPVAEVAVQRDLPFVCVPFGTRNHFARDVGLDRDDAVAALDAFSGRERRIDLGGVNGRAFLNNVSLGLYAQLVHRREGHRRRENAFAQLRALLLLARSRESVDLSVEGSPVDAQLAVVANNAYNLELFSIGERERLDEGRLHLYLARGWRPSEWEEQVYERLRITAGTPRLRAAIDGEPTVLETPLEFSVRARALRVLVPAAPG